jgi:hypothetical protein
MNALWLHLFVFAVAGWINRGQQQVIGYLLEENRVLREQLHGRRLRLTDTQRRRLAVRAKALGTRSRLAVRSARPAIRSASCVAPALPDLTVPRTLRSGSRRALLGAASGGSKRLAGGASWGRERVPASLSWRRAREQAAFRRGSRLSGTWPGNACITRDWLHHSATGCRIAWLQHCATATMVGSLREEPEWQTVG